VKDIKYINWEMWRTFSSYWEKWRTFSTVIEKCEGHLVQKLRKVKDI